MKKFLIFTFFIYSLLIISCSKKESEVIDFNRKFISKPGGSLINAMIGEPSNLIAMIAGDSAASAIAGNIFNTLIKYDENMTRRYTFNILVLAFKIEPKTSKFCKKSQNP